MGNAGPEDLAKSRSGGEPDGVIARIGTVVDKYTIVRMLGRGGMGAVYEARHARLARRVAIKFLLPEFAVNREILRRFENEAKAAGGLEHPNLAAVTDFGYADDGAPYLVLDYLEGQDCAKLLRREGCLSVSRAANIVVQACRGLAIAHKTAIIHRDLKPENLFVTDAGDGTDLIKVLDFGIAKLRASDASVVTGTGATFGTAYYMSPEQARGAGEVDPRTDVWSLGIVLYELLSGRKPFEGEQFLQIIYQILSADPIPLATLRPDLPPALVEAVESALKKDVAERSPSVLTLAEALAPFAGSRTAQESTPRAAAMAPTLPTPATSFGELAPGLEAPRSRLPKAGRRSTLKVALGLAAVIVLIAVVASLRIRHPVERAQSTTSFTTPSPRPEPAPTSLPPPATAAVPAPPASAAPIVRTVFERSEPKSTRRTIHAASKPNPIATPAPPAPNPAPPLENPSPTHRIKIDQEDPFGP